MTSTETGAAIRSAIDRADRTQTWIAERAGMSPATLRRKIRSGNITLPELVRIAAALGVEPASLLPSDLTIRVAS